MMDRVETLCERLKEQLANQSSVEDMLLTVQMIQSELQHLQSAEQVKPAGSAVSIHMPPPIDIHPHPPTEPKTPEERVVVFLDINEADVEMELEEMKKNAEAKNRMGVKNKPPMLFDPVEETPTLIHQKTVEPPAPAKEIHELIADPAETSLNDRLNVRTTEISDVLSDDPIKDLKKAIGINDKFLYISELFRGDEVMYERSIKTINGFSIYPEAEYWIKRELKLKLGWDEKHPTVKQFDQLVKRRFSAT
jgi:hypothetical protein